MARNEYEMLFKLSAQLGAEFNRTFSSAQKTLTVTQKEIQSLNKTQSDIAAYAKQQQAINSVNSKLSVYQQQLQNVQKEIAESENYNSALANRELELKQRIEQTELALNRKKESLEQLSNSLSNAGVNTSNLSEESQRLSSEIKELKQAQEQAANEAKELGNAGVDAMGAFSSAMTASGILKLTEELFEEFKECTGAAIVFESAMAGVAKTTDFTDSEFAAISKEVKDLSLDIPATTKEIAAIGETAGQLGIAKKDLMDFTEIMAMLGTSTNMTSNESATMLAQIASITTMAPQFYDELGATIVELGNNYATTEKNIAEMSLTISAAGSIANMSEADILAISAAVTSLGITSQNGGTQMTKLISDINSAVSSGEDLELWAKVANTSADEFAKAWGEDAASALDSFIIGLNRAYQNGEDVYSILADLGITETRMVTMITSLAKSGDRLTQTLSTANTAWQENTALSAEAEKRYTTTESRLTLLSNSYTNLHTTIGEMFTPELRTLADVGSNILQGINDFAEEHPILVKSLVAIGLEVGAVVAVSTTYVAIKKTLNVLHTLSATLKAKDATATAAQTVATNTQTAATGAATVAQQGLNAAMLANPVVLVTAGIAALTVGTIAFSESEKKASKESEQLTAKSKAQYEQLQKLKAEYKEVSEVYGENSYEAWALNEDIEELSSAYEEGKQTLSEYFEEHEQLMASFEESRKAHTEKIKSYSDEFESANALIQKLHELTNASNGYANNQSLILPIIDQLNSRYKNLGITIDETTGKLNVSPDDMRKVAEDEYARKVREEELQRYVALPGEIKKAEEDLANAQANVISTKAEYDAAKKSYNEYFDFWNGGTVVMDVIVDFGTARYDYYKNNMDSALDDWSAALSAEEEAEKALKQRKDAYGELEEKYSSTEAEVINSAQKVATEKNSKEAQNALKFVRNEYMSVAQAAKHYGITEATLQSKVEASAELEENLSLALQAIKNDFLSTAEAASMYGFTIEELSAAEKVTNITDAVSELSEQYKEAYTAAVDSIAGQYSLWEEAAIVIPTSIGSINTSLETQKAYWSDYTTDLTELLERAKSIDGLGEFLSLHADGSTESVNLIAGMADASNDELKDMLKNWSELQSLQKDAAESLSQYEKDKLTSFQNELLITVESLNLEKEAKLAAVATIEAYIKALQDGKEDVTAIANELALLVSNVLNPGESQYRVPEGIYALSNPYSAFSSNMSPYSSFVARANNTEKNYSITVSPSFNISNPDWIDDVTSFSDRISEMVIEAIRNSEEDTTRSDYK